MSKEYDETNRVTLFATNARGETAPTHQGKVVVTRDMIEKYDDDTYVIAITAWMQESGNIFGSCSSYQAKQDEYKEYLKRKESDKKSKTGKAKAKPVKKVGYKVEDEFEDDIPF